MRRRGWQYGFALLASCVSWHSAWAPLMYDGCSSQEEDAIFEATLDISCASVALYPAKADGTQDTFGSGSVVHVPGVSATHTVILTASHVLRDAAHCRIKTHALEEERATTFEATVWRVHPDDQSDIAVVLCPKKRLTSLELMPLEASSLGPGGPSHQGFFVGWGNSGWFNRDAAGCAVVPCFNLPDIGKMTVRWNKDVGLSGRLNAIFSPETRETTILGNHGDSGAPFVECLAGKAYVRALMCGGHAHHLDMLEACVNNLGSEDEIKRDAGFMRFRDRSAEVLYSSLSEERRKALLQQEAGKGASALLAHRRALFTNPHESDLCWYDYKIGAAMMGYDVRFTDSFFTPLTHDLVQWIKDTAHELVHEQR